VTDNPFPSIDPVDPPDQERRLTDTTARITHLRRRRMVLTAGVAVAAILAVALPLTLAGGSPRSQSVQVVGQPSPTAPPTSATATATTVPSAGGTAATVPATGGTAAPIPPSRATTITSSAPSTNGPSTTGSAEVLAASAPIEAALVNAFITYDHIPARDVAGPYPGSVYYAYDPSDRTYWAMATMQPQASAPTNVMVKFQDGANRVIFARRNGSGWSVVNLVGEPPCLVRQGLPAAIESLWRLSDSSGCTAPTPTTVSPTSSPPPTTTPPKLPGVIFDCTAPPPAARQSRVKPSSIVLACADNGIGVEDMVWTNWTANGAIGTGKVWENNCKPNCAEGTIGYYPATITLSGVVNTTSNGPLFSQLTARYQTAGPNGHTTDHFGLPR
jgi:hypothetical protein